ncbi:alpha/beta fold hydrolase [Martelella soudanensis]|uniref:alpha/beta fold hydrolase n=1 Tax=unclassified Martelella TaxID=2629616 RepID=UPI0015DE3999|nr:MULTISPECIES: alpha/beta fold hydrolase [unclassified Martelella]
MTTLSVPLPDGITLHARVDGPEGAPSVVFVNSVLTDLSVWDAQTDALADRYRVLRYDQRGHGASNASEGPMDFARYGADLLAVMDAAGVDRCAVVCLSMGCPTALAALAVAPDRFAAFVAVDGVMRSAPGRAAFWSERRETALRDGMEAIAAATAPRWLPGEPEDSALSIRLRAMIAGTSVKGFAAATYALSDYDQTTGIACPVLGIAGADDGAMPDAVAKQFGGLAGARTAIIPGAGHLPNFQSPKAFNDALLAFLDQNFPTTKEQT